MILKDANMKDMDYNTFVQVTMPKVEGTLLLDELFKDHSLDFFTLFSSISSLIGVPGQSAYAAANMFMTALVERRRQKGLAGSVIHIGAILGAGYISQMGLNLKTSKAIMGFMSLSVSDFHQLFAEAVAADGQGISTEIAAGIDPFTWLEPQQPRWASNPTMTHLIFNTTSGSKHSQQDSSEKALRLRLLEAESLDKVRILVQDSLQQAIGGLLQLNSEMMKSLHSSTRLDELGIDSILALEIRAWLIDNLRFDLPVLKILSGITIGELVTASLGGINAALIHPNKSPWKTASTSTYSQSMEQVSSYEPSAVGQSAELPTLSTSRVGAPSKRLLPKKLEEYHQMEPLILSTAELSPTQTMFWSALTLFGNKASLNFSALCRVNGHLEIHKLARAAWHLGQQHEALRTCFFNRDGIPSQGIMKESAVKLEHEWIEDLDILEERVESIRQHAFNAERGELVKLLLISNSPASHFVIFGASHLCLDGISARIFLIELFRHYHSQHSLHTPTQYTQYAQTTQVEIDSGRLDHEFDYWKNQYPDFPPVLPTLRVSRITLRPTLETFNSITAKGRISLDTKHRVLSVCRKCRATPFHFYLAVFRVLVWRLSDVEDIAIGTVDAGRNEKNGGSLGVYANVLPLRFRSDLTQQFDVVLQETRTVALEALSNSRVPFQTLVDK